MTIINTHMDEESYLKGIALFDAIFEFADDKGVEAYDILSETLPHVTPERETMGILDAFSLVGEQIQANQDRIDKIEAFESEFKQNILNLIENSQLTAWGFKLPRDIEDKRVKIPADLILNGEINWENSELNSQAIEITGIRLFKKVEFNEKTELKLVSNNLSLNKKEVKNKISEIKTVKKTNFADLDPELHIDEKKASEFLGISPRTLQGYRSKGGGPKFAKIGARTVRYKIKDLINWTDKRDNTS